MRDPPGNERFPVGLKFDVVGVDAAVHCLGASAGLNTLPTERSRGVIAMMTSSHELTSLLVPFLPSASSALPFQVSDCESTREFSLNISDPRWFSCRDAVVVN